MTPLFLFIGFLAGLSVLARFELFLHIYLVKDFELSEPDRAVRLGKFCGVKNAERPAHLR